MSRQEDSDALLCRCRSDFSNGVVESVLRHVLECSLYSSAKVHCGTATAKDKLQGKTFTPQVQLLEVIAAV